MAEKELESMIADGNGKLTSKYGKVNEQSSFIYAWMAKEDYQKMQQLKTLKEKRQFFIVHVRYVGKDADGSRYEGHLLPFEIGTPFDRFLKVALMQGLSFVSIYLKVPSYATMEAIVLKKLFDFGPNASLLLNKNNGSSLSGLSDKEMHIIFYAIINKLIESPSHINHTTKNHASAVQRFIGHLQDGKKQQFKNFLAEAMNLLQTNDFIQHKHFAHQLSKPQFDEFINDLIECGIVVKKEKDQFVSAFPSKLK